MRFRLLVIPVVVIAGSMSLGYAIFAPMIRHANDSAHRSSCQSNLKQIALATSQYLEENDRRFPAISRGAMGWADALQPYTQSWALFHCPIVGQPADAHSSDYFFSARLANISIAQLKFPTQTISFGEGLARGGTNSHFSELPFDWKSDVNSPAQRHLGGASYAFADGHAKWLRPTKITVNAPSTKPDDWNATFAVR